VRVTQGDGGGLVTLSNSLITGRLVVIGGAGVDDVQIDSIFVIGQTRIATRGGDDLVRFANSIFVSTVRINGGGGADTFEGEFSNLFLGGLLLSSVETTLS
jgi:hypothetical protein